MACFCGCETYVKNEDGFKIACVKCEHGPQNHDDAFRDAARKNESQSQKRDADLDKNYSPIILTKTLFDLLPSNSP